MTDVEPETNAKKGGKQKRARRNYMAEYAALQGKVDMALKLLSKGISSTPPESRVLIEMAVELLES